MPLRTAAWATANGYLDWDEAESSLLCLVACVPKAVFQILCELNGAGCESWHVRKGPSDLPRSGSPPSNSASSHRYITPCHP